MAIILAKKSSIKKWSLFMILSLSKYPTRKRRNSKCSTVTNVISGLVKVVSGLQNSREAHAFSYRRRLSLVARWLVRFRQDGRLGAMAYRKILSHRCARRSFECIRNNRSIRVIQVHAPIQCRDMFLIFAIGSCPQIRRCLYSSIGISRNCQ